MFDPDDVSILAVIYRNFTLPTLLKLDWFKGQSEMKSWYLITCFTLQLKGFPQAFCSMIQAAPSSMWLSKPSLQRPLSLQQTSSTRKDS